MLPEKLLLGWQLAQDALLEQLRARSPTSPEDLRQEVPSAFYRAREALTCADVPPLVGSASEAGDARDDSWVTQCVTSPPLARPVAACDVHALLSTLAAEPIAAAAPAAAAVAAAAAAPPNAYLSPAGSPASSMRSMSPVPNTMFPASVDPGIGNAGRSATATDLRPAAAISMTGKASFTAFNRKPRKQQRQRPQSASPSLGRVVGGPMAGSRIQPPQQQRQQRLPQGNQKFREIARKQRPQKQQLPEAPQISPVAKPHASASVPQPDTSGHAAAAAPTAPPTAAAAAAAADDQQTVGLRHRLDQLRESPMLLANLQARVHARMHEARLAGRTRDWETINKQAAGTLSRAAKADELRRRVVEERRKQAQTARRRQTRRNLPRPRTALFDDEDG